MSGCALKIFFRQRQLVDIFIEDPWQFIRIDCIGDHRIAGITIVQFFITDDLRIRPDRTTKVSLLAIDVRLTKIQVGIYRVVKNLYVFAEQLV